MAGSFTVIRIKRPLDCEPSESIVVNAKRRRLDSTKACSSLVDEKVSSTILRHAGTLQAEEKLEQTKITKLVNNTLYQRYRDDYKKKPSTPTPKKTQKNMIKDILKKNSISRYRIVNAKRGIEEDSLAKEDLDKNLKVYDAVQHDILSQPGFGTVDDVITCNGEALTKEKKDFVYDYYVTSDAVVSEEWNDNILEIEHITTEEVDNSTYTTEADPDDDDENAEENWRNDYPDEDEDELLYESEEEYLVHQINKFSLYDSDESYDADNYDENDDFDDEGNLIRPSEHCTSTSVLKTFAHRIHQQYDDDDDSD